MSNETDLDWLARNVHVWPDCADFVRIHTNGQEPVFVTKLGAAYGDNMFTHDQWLARRAELQNKPTEWPKRANWLAQHEDGEWTFYADSADNPPQNRPDGNWYSDDVAVKCCHSGEVLGDWRDTLERRPQVEADITDPFDPEFRPTSVSNETVQLEQPIAVAGTGNGSAAESSFLVGRVIDLLRTSVDHFSADELADMSELTGAELTKRDAAVCGGQKYLDAHWFERGELPPVGAMCLYVVSDRLSVEVEITAHAKFGLCFVEKEKPGEYYVSKTAELHRFSPIRTERDLLIEMLADMDGSPASAGKVADAILAAGFSLRGK